MLETQKKSAKNSPPPSSSSSTSRHSTERPEVGMCVWGDGGGIYVGGRGSFVNPPSPPPVYVGGRKAYTRMPYYKNWVKTMKIVQSIYGTLTYFD